MLSASLPPCRRYHPVEVESRYLPACDPRCCLHPGAKDSAFEISTFRGYQCVRLRCSPVTRSRPSDDSVDGLQVIGFPPPCHPSYKAAGPLPWWDCLPLNAPAFAGRTAPQRVLAAHLPDQRSNLGINPWTAADVARLPAPVGAETASVPADHGLRLDDDDRVEERWLQAIQPHHPLAIDVPQWHTLWVPAAQHYDLLAQEEILGFKAHSSREPRPDSKQQLGQQRDHRPLQYHTSSCTSSRIGISVGTGRRHRGNSDPWRTASSIRPGLGFK